MSGKRSSLLSQAGDALSFRFGRRRPIRQPAPPVVLAVPHVIDISAPPPDEEIEERQRLRDAAAQSLGLGPLLEPTEEEDEQEQDTVVVPLRRFLHRRPFSPPSKLWRTAFQNTTLLPVSAYSLSQSITHRTTASWNASKSTQTGWYSLLTTLNPTLAPRPTSSRSQGADVGALRRDWNPTDDGRTVWLLQFFSPADAQRWISAIKSAIFEQRYVCIAFILGAFVYLSLINLSEHTAPALAPLPPALTPNSEPRGDMDVMLSLRLAASASGTGSAPRTPRSSTPASSRSVRSVATAPNASTIFAGSFQNPFAQNKHKSRSPSSSTTTTVRSNPGTGATRPTAVAALKGLFSGCKRKTTTVRVPPLPRRSSPSGPRPSPDTAALGIGVGHGHPARATSFSSSAHPASTSPFPYAVRVSSASSDELAPASSLSLSSAGSNVNGTPNPNGAESFGRMGTLLGNIHANGVPNMHTHSGAFHPAPLVRVVSGASAVGWQDEGAPGLPDSASNSTPSATDDLSDAYAQELIAPKRRTLSALGRPFGLGGGSGGGEVTAAAATTKTEALDGGSFGLRLLQPAAASGSTGERRDRAIFLRTDMRRGEWEWVHNYAHANATGNGYPSGSAGRATRESARKCRWRSGSGTMYAHPHANGSSGDRGELGVRPGGGARTGSVYAGSVKTFERDDGRSRCAMERERARTPSVRTRAGRWGRGSRFGRRSGTGRMVGGLDAPLVDAPAPAHAARFAPTCAPHYLAFAFAFAFGRDDPASIRCFVLIPERDRDSRDRDRDRDRPGSRSSFGSTKWTSRGKRVSTGGVSGVSVGSAGGVSVGAASAGSAGSASIFGPPTTGGVSGLSGLSGSPPARTRTSMPPPPRPAPTGALPPAPGDSGGGGSPNGRTSFRESRAPSLSVSFLDPPPAPPAIVSSKSLPPPTTTPQPPNANNKASFRESMSMTHRALRLSLMAPKPPPAGVLPPRPDEIVAATHKRTSSATGSVRGSILSTLANGSGSLTSIPGSPASPPPRGPLPPTPAPAGPPPLALARHTSLKLKKRLRILSAPPAPHPVAEQEQRSSQEWQEPAPRPTSIDVPSSRPRGMTLSSFLSASTPTTPTTAGPLSLPSTIAAALARLDGGHDSTPPQTPIGEKIIQFHTQNDPSFLELSTSSTPVLRPLPALPSVALSGDASDPPAPENEYAEIVSLLPPPRRGSRQISVKELERFERVPTPPLEPELVPLPRDEEDEDAGPGKLFSLSHHGSVISLGM
ncbi:hypothetical protein C8R46DRAFT_1103248 [Mycena filopes]|nr:hypothetical protein C8R46DRAFT_1103248 [Mycena filopes]